MAFPFKMLVFKMWAPVKNPMALLDPMPRPSCAPELFAAALSKSGCPDNLLWQKEKAEHSEELVSFDHEEVLTHDQRYPRGERPVYKGQEVFQAHEAPRSGKRARSPPPQMLSPPPKPLTWGQGRKAPPKRPKVRDPDLEADQREHLMVEVRTLRFSQLSCKDSFTCGRTILGLIDALKDGTVTLGDPFLRLSVFECGVDRKTKKPNLICIDNRRLLALKQYAIETRQPRLMVHINFYSQTTISEVYRFFQNCDRTDGRSITVRRSTET